ncbi:MAG: DNA repair protein RadA, partial [Asticcacaulis sp.]|nr:DNA repair protein RadA [Asticcacaulis sp.]
MARDSAVYVCQACGGVHNKWAGQCSACQAWNTLVQEAFSTPPGGLKPEAGKISRLNKLQFETLDSVDEAPERMVTGIDEFDRVCG